MLNKKYAVGVCKDNISNERVDHFNFLYIYFPFRSIGSVFLIGICSDTVFPSMSHRENGTILALNSKSECYYHSLSSLIFASRLI